MASAAIVLLTTVSLVSCAKPAPQPAKSPEEKPIDCSGAGSGMARAPTEKTKAAMAEATIATSTPLAELYEKVAAGQSSAQVELGLRYANGTGVDQDHERAAGLFEAAIKQGNPLGYFYLGTSYINGLGREKDEARATFLWEQSAQEGHPLSQYWLAFMIANGRAGITASWCAAAPLFEAAATQDVGDSAFMLGYGYQTGQFSAPDYEKAAAWYRKATSRVLNQRAQFNLRVMIEAYQVEWREGDPGKPPPPKPEIREDEPKLQILDESGKVIG